VIFYFRFLKLKGNLNSLIGVCVYFCKLDFYREYSRACYRFIEFFLKLSEGGRCTSLSFPPSPSLSFSLAFSDCRRLRACTVKRIRLFAWEAGVYIADKRTYVNAINRSTGDYDSARDATHARCNSTDFLHWRRRNERRRIIAPAIDFSCATMRFQFSSDFVTRHWQFAYLQ